MKKVILPIISILSFTLIFNVNVIADSGNKFTINSKNILSGLSDNFLNLNKYISSRRGGSFGGFRGSRRSFGRSSSRRSMGRTARPLNPQKTPSFGGTRISSQHAKAKYGTPRRVQPVQGTNAAGMPMNYNIHHYGGFSNSLMTGYMMGNMAWWMMAPAMLYSRPVYVEKPDGSVDVYPPSFDWGKLFTVLIVLFIIGYVIRNALRVKQSQNTSYSGSSFS